MGRVKLPVLVKKGAEASLFLVEWHGRKAIAKRRLPKRYRASALDEQIRTFRTVHEPQLFHEAKKAGVPTPLVYLVDVRNAEIVMEFVEGTQVKRLLNRICGKEREHLCQRIGESVARLHGFGVVHGDLTTSNMISTPEGRIIFVDFGLGEKTEELEAKAVDLHLMKRALQSTHFRFARNCFDAVMEGYGKVLGSDNAKEVSEKIDEIERRGRYVAERKA